MHRIQSNCHSINNRNPIRFTKRKNRSFGEQFFKFGAENEARTRDPQLGKLMLYRLSYFRKMMLQK